MMRHRILLTTILLLNAAVFAGDAAKKPLKVLVTGFGLFDNRSTNGSWVAAKPLEGVRNGLTVKCKEVEVVWGEPLKVLKPVCDEFKPDVIISLGEGRPGFFDIETKARNSHIIPVPTKEGQIKYLKPKDVKGEFPADSIDERGPAEYKSENPDKQILEALQKRGYPIRISQNAGQYLCEEMLYTTCRLKELNKNIKRVVFVHVPPHKTEFMHNGAKVTADDKYLQDFAAALLEEATKDLR